MGIDFLLGDDNPFVFILLMVIAPRPTPPSDHTLHLPLRQVACLIHLSPAIYLYYTIIAGVDGWWWVKQWPTKDQTVNSCLIYLCTFRYKLIAAHYSPDRVCNRARICFLWTVDRNRFYWWRARGKDWHLIQHMYYDWLNLILKRFLKLTLFYVSLILSVVDQCSWS